MDGAGRWARIRYVTLPGIKPTIMILLLMICRVCEEVQRLIQNMKFQQQLINDTCTGKGIMQNTCNDNP